MWQPEARDGRVSKALSLLIFFLFCLARAAAAATTISTNPTANTTWTAAGSPYTVTAAITVAAGITLTVEPGVQVLFDPNTGLTIAGALVAVGGSSSPISFSPSSPGGNWKGLEVNGTSTNPATASLSYVTVASGGSTCTYCADLYVEDATAAVTHSTFTNSGTDGIWVYSGEANVSDSTFTSNAGYAINYQSATSNPVLAGLTATGNGTDAVAIGGGTMQGNHVWEAAGLPYVVTGSPTLSSGSVLTISPGVQVRFKPVTTLHINGTLQAVGSAAAPIVLTGTTASTGSWGGLDVNGSTAVLATATLDYVTIAYGGGGCTYCADLYVEDATAEVTHSTFTNSGTDGIWVYSGVANVSNGSFTNNVRYAIKYESASSNPVLAALTATGNGTDAVAIGGGTMQGNHVWEAGGLPYVVTGSPALSSGSVLTVSPGVQVRFNPGTTLHINGTLQAVGSAAAPIVLTGTTASTGSWGGVDVNGGATPAVATLHYVTIAYGGGANCSYCADLYVEDATADVTHATFTNSGTDGIWVWSGIANVSESSFTSNARYAIKYESASLNPVLAALTATGNGTDAVAIGGGIMQGNHVWEAAGLPYVVTGSPALAAGSMLTISPGVQVRFTQDTQLALGGALRAIGTAAQPIVLNGLNPVPGSWVGLQIHGGSNSPASATLDYVTIAHGGGANCTYCANLYLEIGFVQVTHSVIRDSGKDGVWAYYGAPGSSIETSQIIGNAGYGVENGGTNLSEAFYAANNWWGSPSGPTVDNGCNPNGTGSRIKGPVAFSPFLTAADMEPAPVAPGDALILSLTPRRWFAPADNSTKVYVKLTLRSGNGQPLPGRSIRLTSTLGQVIDGGVTDVNGETFATLISGNPGDAVLTAATDVQTVCEFARSQPSTITFTSTASNPLRPDIEAPYMDDGIEIIPEPITRGVLTKVRANLKNTNNVPITVDATFGFAQSGIGLTFGPIGEVRGKVITANSEDVIEISWTPVVAGHYCMQLEYSAQAASSTGQPSPLQVTPLAGGSGRSQRNLNVYNGPLGNPSEKDSLNRADKAFNLVKKIPAGPTQIHKYLLGRWWDWVKDTASKIGGEMGGDPPQLDYQTIAIPAARPILPPVTPDSEVSAARVAAMNALNDALLDVMVQGNAVVISMDRAGGAAQAEDLLWSSQQTAAILQYKKQMGNALIAAADKTDAFRQLLINEGVTTIPITADDVRAYQQRLGTQGFTAEEINDAHLIGFNDTAIETFRQEIIAADPNIVAGERDVSARR